MHYTSYLLCIALIYAMRVSIYKPVEQHISNGISENELKRQQLKQQHQKGKNLENLLRYGKPRNVVCI